MAALTTSASASASASAAGPTPGKSAEPATLVTGAFAAWLEASRYELNLRIAEAGRAAPAFDPLVLAAALRELVAPAVEAVEARGEGFATLVSSAMFDIALDLCAQGRLVGAVRDGWVRLLPVLTEPLAAEPHRVVASITNALANLDRSPGARSAQWIKLMAALAPHCPTPDALLRAGQVASWRCGMAAYRQDALVLAAALDEPTLHLTLGVAAHELPRFAADPWFDPARAPTVLSTPTAAAPAWRAARRVGGFRGFGGPFAQPPIVGLDGDRVVAFDGCEAWFVFADAYGSAVVRAPVTTDMAPSPAGAVPPALTSVPELTSWADTPAGLVATSALSHAVLFLGPPP